MSCSAEIPPAWIHAINSNICPGCGGIIMNNESQMILAEVRDALNQMPNNPEGLAGWLLSNYKLVKIGDAEPTEFHQRLKSDDELVKTDVTKAASSLPKASSADEKTQLFQKFLQRTGVKLPDVTDMKKKAGTMAEIENDEEIKDDLDNDEEVDIMGVGENIPAPATDPRESIRQKQLMARRALASGGGKFSRS
jgi:hypothetical protein